MTRIRTFCVLGVLFFATEAQAQAIALPQVDDVSFFVQAGAVHPGGEIEGAPRDGFGVMNMSGWGFETLFTMRSTPKWNVELALGYSQLFMRAKLADTYALRGTVRNFPSTSIYFTYRPKGLYLGLGTGPVSLSNVTAYTPEGARFTVGGDTLNLALHGGWVTDLSDELNLFVEGAYHARYIGGLTYGSGAPSTGLPPSAYFGGVVLSVGVQVTMKPAKKTPSPDDEIQRQQAALQRGPGGLPDSQVLMKTICATDPVPPDWVKADTRWDPASCGAPSTPMPNVWVIAYLDPAAPAGTLMEICADAATPLTAGWTKLGSRWSSDRCGQPTDPTKANVTQVRR